jgi:hypothetical protein
VRIECPTHGFDKPACEPIGYPTLRHHAAVPDDLDYVWLGRLIDHPESWSAGDLTAARQLVADQQIALDEEHPKDARGRQAKQDVIDALEAAIERHIARRTR